jgi:large subunit ribosomal protein L7/L12
MNTALTVKLFARISEATTLAAAKAYADALQISIEQDSLVSITVESFSGSMIDAIKAIRGVSDLGLRDAKDFCEALPRIWSTGVTLEEANRVRRAMAAGGLKVSIK